MTDQPVTPTLQDSVKALAITRQALATKKAELFAEQQKFDAEHAELIKEVNLLVATEGAEETVVRTLALDQFKANGEKAVFPGVEIKMYDTPVYELPLALGWACLNKPEWVRVALDTKSFEKYLKEIQDTRESVPEQQTVPGSVVKVPKPNISKDLSQHLTAQVETKEATK
jgi:hypothetical protein